VADYFLFQIKRGYCDYYATAMVVLARAAGLPARLATGYATGAYSAESGAFTVTEADAHSWPEVFFPGTGWVAFEPTASRSPVGESQGFAPLEPYLPTPGSIQPAGSLRALGPNTPWVILLVGLFTGAAAIALIYWAILRRKKRGRRLPQQTLEAWYRSLCRDGSRLRVAIRRSDTPLEVSQKLGARLEQISASGKLQEPLKPAAAEIQELVSGYMLSAYSQTQASPAEMFRLKNLWSKLRFRMWLAWLAASVDRGTGRS
jgi:hypothetical protein